MIVLRRNIPLLMVAILACVAVCSAQSDTARSAAPADTSVFRRADTLHAHRAKDPMTATLLSIIPGGGQVYNHDYFRAVLFAGACGFFLGEAIYYQVHFSQKASQVDALAPTDPTLPLLKQQREFYRDQRDQTFAYYLGCHILCMIDAYVGAHLFDFNVDDISSKVTFDPFGQRVNLSLRW